MRYIYGFVRNNLIIIFGIYTAGIYLDLYGKLEGPGDSVDSELPRSLVDTKIELPRNHLIKRSRYLFGDTHVHTTYSTDAFLWSLPILNGEGPHPISDACDFARFCANLDFWVTTDHAEALNA